MSVEATLVERGNRYGDFSDHAAICQRIKMAMIAGEARWARLPDTHKQALEVIADKIARILSGDPNYADNWHDIQGYAKLIEDRLPKMVDASTSSTNSPSSEFATKQALLREAFTPATLVTSAANRCKHGASKAITCHYCLTEITDKHQPEEWN
jgi:hypothetical protein